MIVIIVLVMLLLVLVAFIINHYRTSMQKKGHSFSGGQVGNTPIILPSSLFRYLKEYLLKSSEVLSISGSTGNIGVGLFQQGDAWDPLVVKIAVRHSFDFPQSFLNQLTFYFVLSCEKIT